METPKKFFLFQGTELFYISDKENPEKKTFYLSESSFLTLKNGEKKHS